jgi:hypothetical protein
MNLYPDIFVFCSKVIYQCCLAKGYKRGMSLPKLSVSDLVNASERSLPKGVGLGLPPIGGRLDGDKNR